MMMEETEETEEQIEEEQVAETETERETPAMMMPWNAYQQRQQGQTTFLQGSAPAPGPSSSTDRTSQARL
jgi:hypothetical protein